MNRQARRRIERTARRRERHDGDVVLLQGGPMDGWVVKHDAPALRAGWPPPRPDYDYGPGPGRWGRYGAVGRDEDGQARSRWIPDADELLAQVPGAQELEPAFAEQPTEVDLIVHMSDGRRAVFWRAPAPSDDPGAWTFGYLG